MKVVFVVLVVLAIVFNVVGFIGEKIIKKKFAAIAIRKKGE